MAWLYILKSVNHPKTYVGSTNDIERRLTEHNAGKSTFSNRYRPWVIAYTEELPDISSARTREKYYKSAAGRRAIKKRGLTSSTEL